MSARSSPATPRAPAAQLRKTFETLDFNSIVNHGIPAELIARMTEQSRLFHALPPERKLACRVDQNQRGYIPPKGAMIRVSTYNRNTRYDTGGVMVLANEYPDDHPQVRAGTRFYGHNPWPAELPHFRATVEEYLAAMNALGHRLMSLWALALDLPGDFFAPCFAEPYTYMRLSYYAAQEELAENEFGQSPHADAGL
ncbi:MAG: isopenicillin N synthase family oxygenase [Alphaproteobacteria bacterium]|nr:isopenicillin N synthase family oxygenase [Alphaproteobacteria bacterium]